MIESQKEITENESCEIQGNKRHYGKEGLNMKQIIAIAALIIAAALTGCGVNAFTCTDSAPAETESAVTASLQRNQVSPSVTISDTVKIAYGSVK